MKNSRLPLYLFVIGQEDGCLIKENDYGEDLLLKHQKERQYFIRVIQVTVEYLKSLERYMVDLIYVFYQLEHINQDNY